MLKTDTKLKTLKEYAQKLLNHGMPISVSIRQFKTCRLCHVSAAKTGKAVTELWPRGYKTFFVLNSIEHEILNAHKYKNIKKFGFF